MAGTRQSGTAERDPYRWLEDAHHPDTVRWEAEREADFARAAAGWTARGAFAARLARLTADLGAASAPRPAGGRLFHERYASRAEHPHLVVTGPGGGHRVLLDPAALDPTGRTTLEAWEPSWDGRLLSYQVAAGGTEHASLSVLDVDSGEVLDGPIDRVRRSTVAWCADGRSFYYVRHAGQDRYHRRVYLHVVGTDPAADVPVFGEGRGRTQFYAVRTSADGRWLVLSASAGTSQPRDVWLADLSASEPGRPRFRVVQEGVDARTSVHVAPGTGPDGDCYLLTDLDARRGRLARTTPADPGPGMWKDLIPEDPEAVLEDVALLAGPAGPVLLAAWTRHAVGEVTVHDPADGSLLRTLPLPACCTVGRLRAGTGEAWFTVSRFTAPAVVYRYDAGTGSLEPRSSAVVGLRTRQAVFSSADGTPVRMFVIAAGDPDRPRPAILTGYGGFGMSLTPSYSPDALAWVEAGGVYAVANVRGGGEEGEDWHRAGMREHKQNSVDDFDAAARYLVSAGWTTPDRLGCWGASNGGLLVGAALTQHPRRYAAAVCMAPLLDMARYELTGMGPSWAGEYGSAADPDQLRWLLSYSPYHHVRDGAGYPATMFMVFDGDSRVDPLHARKMCAAMRAAGAGTVLYRLERGVGHGARALSSRVAVLADLLAFLADHLGLDGVGG
jgi:prolyl oligopeptidase